MSIEVECRSCGLVYDVDDSREGQRVSCRECGETITVRRGRSRRQERNDYDEPPSTKAPVGLIIGLVVGSLLLLVAACGGAIWYISWSIGRGVDRFANAVDDIAKKAKERVIVNEAQARANLTSPEAIQRLQAVMYLESHPLPRDEARRDDLRRAIEKLLDDQDLHVRNAAQRLHARLRAP